MKITQLRNASLILEYNETKFLVDPVFAPKGTYPPFPSILRANEYNPLKESPLTIEEMSAVDAVIITHLHSDHFDEEAKQYLPKTLPLFVQNETDKSILSNAGFQNVTVLSRNTFFRDITLIKTPGQHGYAQEIYEALGDVCGVIIHAKGDKKIYIAGDTVWYDQIEKTLLQHKPDFIILNAGANSVMDQQLIMGKDDVKKVHETLPDATILATHMEAVNHWTLSREELKSFAQKHDFSHCILIPEDGETLFIE